MTTYDATVFYDDLVRHGLVVPAGPLGAFGRGPVFEDVLEAMDALIVRTAKDDGVESMTFPPVIDKMIIERTGYMDSFPTLCGAIHSFVGNEREARTVSQQIAEGKPWGGALQQTDVVLNPAACYPFYPTCTGTVPAGGRHVTMLAWVYRHEPSLEPTRMRSFRMREFIRIGNPETVVEWRDTGSHAASSSSSRSACRRRPTSRPTRSSAGAARCSPPARSSRSSSSRC